MNAHAMYAEVNKMENGDMVTSHANLVKRIAFHMMNRLPPSVQAEDLIQAGGLRVRYTAKPEKQQKHCVNSSKVLDKMREMKM